MRGAVTVGFPAGLTAGAVVGRVFDEMMGVEVDTVMVSGRMVPAMASNAVGEIRQRAGRERARFRDF